MMQAMLVLTWRRRDLVRLSVILVGLILVHDGGMASEPHLSMPAHQGQAPVRAHSDIHHDHAHGGQAEDPSTADAHSGGMHSPGPPTDPGGCMVVRSAVAQPRESSARKVLAEHHATGWAPVALVDGPSGVSREVAPLLSPGIDPSRLRAMLQVFLN